MLLVSLRPDVRWGNRLSFAREKGRERGDREAGRREGIEGERKGEKGYIHKIREKQIRWLNVQIGLRLKKQHKIVIKWL